MLTIQPRADTMPVRLKFYTIQNVELVHFHFLVVPQVNVME